MGEEEGRWGGVLISLRFLSTPLSSMPLLSVVIGSDACYEGIFLGHRRAFVSLPGGFSSHNVFEISLDPFNWWELNKYNCGTEDSIPVNKDSDLNTQTWNQILTNEK